MLLRIGFSPRFSVPALRLFGLILLAVLTVDNLAAATGTRIEGFHSANFGMSPAEVETVLGRDGFKRLGERQNGKDHVISAENDRGWITSRLVYVFPSRKQQLALVVEIFPGLASDEKLEKELTEHYGSPMETDRETILRMMKTEQPGLTDVTLWADMEGRNRLIRLLSFEDRVAVEYMERDLLMGVADTEKAMEEGKKGEVNE